MDPGEHDINEPGENDILEKDKRFRHIVIDRRERL